MARCNYVHKHAEEAGEVRGKGRGGCCRDLEDMTHEACGQWSHPRGPALCFCHRLIQGEGSSIWPTFIERLLQARQGQQQWARHWVEGLTTLLPSPFGNIQITEELLELTLD